MTDEFQFRPVAVTSDYSDDVCSSLRESLEAALHLSSESVSPRTIQNRRRALNVLVPLIEEAGVFTLDPLRSPDGLGPVKSVLTRKIDGGDWQGSTWLTYCRNFAGLCASAGFSPEERKRLSGALNHAIKDAIPIPSQAEREPNMEDVHNLVQTMDDWLLAEATVPRGRGGSKEPVCTSLPHGYKGRPMTALRRDRLLAYAAIKVATVARMSSIIRLRKQDVSGSRIRLPIVKHQIIPKMLTFELYAPLMRFVRPALGRVNGDSGNVFSKTSDILYGDLRPLCEASGWPTDAQGSYRLHDLRKIATAAGVERGVSPFEMSGLLGNKPSTAADHYATLAEAESGLKAQGAWADHLEVSLADPPEWRFNEDSLDVAWEFFGKSGTPGEVFFPRVEGSGIPEGIPEGAWRFRSVLVREKDWYEGCEVQMVAYESNRGDLLLTHWPCGTDGIAWLEKGDLHRAWWACLDLNQGLLLPKQQA